MITFKNWGRLGRWGNMAYQLAGLIGLARKTGQSWAVPLAINYDHKDRFNTVEDIEIYKYLVNELHAIPNECLNLPHHWISWGYHEFMPPENIDIAGHLQSWKYFSHCMDEVRHYLTFKDEYPDNDFCALHWRAGDYTDGIETYHPRMKRDYYLSAMECMPPGTKFMVFSDDYEGVKELLKDLPFTYFSKSVDYIDDFKKMKACRHHIISNSSFSAMAATLANQPDKIVVSPSGDNWFGGAAMGLTNFEIMMPDWIQLKMW